MKNSEFDKLVKSGQIVNFSSMGETFDGLPARRDTSKGYIWYTDNGVERLGQFDITDLDFTPIFDIDQLYIDHGTVIDLNCYDNMVIGGQADKMGIVQGYDIQIVILLDTPDNLEDHAKKRLATITKSRYVYGDPDYVYIGDANGGWIDYLKSPKTYKGQSIRIDTDWLVSKASQW